MIKYVKQLFFSWQFWSCKEDRLYISVLLEVIFFQEKTLVFWGNWWSHFLFCLESSWNNYRIFSDESWHWSQGINLFILQVEVDLVLLSKLSRSLFTFSWKISSNISLSFYFTLFWKYFLRDYLTLALFQLFLLHQLLFSILNFLDIIWLINLNITK